RYHCPITRKEFADSVHVVAVKTSGNVYAFDAISELNYTLNNFKDLLTDISFTKKDVITIQNPTNIERLNCAKFYHLVHNLKVINDKDEDINNLRLVSPETLGALNELEKTYKSPAISLTPTQKNLLTARNKAHYSTGTVSYGFTCTAFAPTTIQTPGILADDSIIYPRIKKKGYIQMVTNFGNLNIQLHCDLVIYIIVILQVPKASENFIRLCRASYYNDTSLIFFNYLVFFRLVPGHIIQGGDPNGTGDGGQSIFGKPFKDELRANLKYDQRGILGMTNTERDLNMSQLYPTLIILSFITFGACESFNNRYTLFGKIVGGLETLNKIEEVPTDDDYRPLVSVRIVQCNVFVDPFEEADLELEQQFKVPEKKEERKELIYDEKLKDSTVIGKYITKRSIDKNLVKKHEKPTKAFKDFSMHWLLPYNLL
ncbi:hypothetical protein HZS_1326, partial [Henneguya salminicola]